MMRYHKIEESLMIGRYHFLVIFTDHGTRNGYLGIPNEEFIEILKKS